MQWRYVIEFLVVLTIIIVIIALVIRPVFIKPIVNTILAPSDYFPLDENAVETKKYTYYVHPDAKKLVIYFCGGAFIFTNRKATYGFLNELHKHLNGTHDILVFSYKTRFGYTLQQTLRDITQTINEFITLQKFKYDDFIGIGMSAGNLLLGAFINKEASQDNALKMGVQAIGVRITKTISICGIFRLLKSFNSNFIDLLIRTYVTIDTPHIDLYTFYNHVVKKQLVLSVNSDFFYKQSLAYINTNKCEYLIFDDPKNNVPHNFITFIKTQVAIDALNKIKEFILKD